MKAVCTLLALLSLGNVAFGAYEMFEDDVAVVETDTSESSSSMSSSGSDDVASMSNAMDASSQGGSTPELPASESTSGFVAGLADMGLGGNGGGGSSSAEAEVDGDTNGDGGGGDDNPDAVSLPEPSTAIVWTLLGLCAMGLLRFTKK
jgi:hypothetical protein